MNSVAIAGSARARPPGLDRLGVVGNGQLIALVGADGDIAWCCWPRPDGEPVFFDLPASDCGSRGRFSIAMVGHTQSDFCYRRNTAILESCVRDDRGNALRVTTWSPKFRRRDEDYRPRMLIRRLEPVSGRPTVRVSVSAAAQFGQRALPMRACDHHVRFGDAERSLRVTTDASVSYLTEDRAFIVDRCMHFILSDDEPLPAPVHLIGAVDTAEAQVRFVEDLIVREGASGLQSVYGLTGERNLEETQFADSLTWGPLRTGNLAHRQAHHDVYGSAVLACAPAFHDERFAHRGDLSLFHSLEALGERAVPLFDRPDSGPFETRARTRRYTHSAVMCWAACDRLAGIARQLALADRAGFWKKRADFLRMQILSRIWRESRGTLSAVLDDELIDASLLHLPELGFIDARDPRWLATLEAMQTRLRCGDLLSRSTPVAGEEPEQIYTLASLWWANAQARAGYDDEAREIFESVLRGRNALGLLSERIDARTGELWGNFPHTGVMSAIISTAARLSSRWDDAI